MISIIFVDNKSFSGPITRFYLIFNGLVKSFIWELKVKIDFLIHNVLRIIFCTNLYIYFDLR